MEVSSKTLLAVFDLAKLVFAFGKTNRVTHHPDGVTPESDTDHTVMVGMLACAYAARHAPHLDIGKVAQYALVHDFVEVYASDTPTFSILSVDEVSQKQQKEAAALERITEEYRDSFPWLPETIARYEALEDPEARFVKVVDKVLPKIAHILDGGVTVDTMGHTQESVDVYHAHQLESIENSFGADQPEAMALLRAVIKESDAFLRSRKEKS